MAITQPARTMEPSEPEPAAPRRRLLGRIAEFSSRRRRLVLATWFLIALVAAPLAATLTGALSGAGWEAQGSTAQKVRDELRRDFPALGAENPVVVYHQATPIATNPSGLQQLVAKLQHAPRTTSVANPLQLPKTAGLISRDGRTAHRPVAQHVTTDASRPEAAALLERYVGSLRLSPQREGGGHGRVAGVE